MIAGPPFFLAEDVYLLEGVVDVVINLIDLVILWSYELVPFGALRLRMRVRAIGNAFSRAKHENSSNTP